MENHFFFFSYGDRICSSFQYVHLASFSQSLLRAFITIHLSLACLYFCSYNNKNEDCYDPAKNAKNIEERSLSFELAEEFNFESALIWQDVRSDYGELRFNALGYINNRLYHMTFTPRSGAMRVISLRKANSREVIKYAKT